MKKGDAIHVGVVLKEWQLGEKELSLSVRWHQTQTGAAVYSITQREQKADTD